MTTETEEPKICADCKHLIGVRHRPEDVDKWRCGHPKNIEDEKLDLVTGITNKWFAVNDLHILRSGHLHCSREGSWYEEYVPPTPPASIPKPIKSLAEDL